MKILHVGASLSVEWGGPPRVIASLSQALEVQGVASTVFAVDTHPGSEVVEGLPNAQIAELSLFSKVWPVYSKQSRSRIAGLAQDADILHIHELWHHPSFAAAKVARAAGKPYVVSSHGELQDSFFNRKLYKKWPFWLAIQKPLLQSAAVVHVLNEREHSDAIRRRITSPIETIPNGVDIDFLQRRDPEAHDRFLSRYPATNGKTVVLYMGRVTPIKRLELLVEAVVKANSGAGGSKYHLMILGPESEGYATSLRRLIGRSDANSDVTLGGSVSGQSRLDAFSASDVYAQSSSAEGSSMSLLEAGASGLPIVVTRECEFPAEEYGLGIVADSNPEAFARALVKVRDEHRSGRVPNADGLKRFKLDHSWAQVAERFKVMYQRALE